MDAACSFLVYIKYSIISFFLLLVCKASGHPDQVKGRWIEAKNSSQKKLEEVDSLIDKEIDVAYKRATKILKDNAALHKVLIDAMMKFQTIGKSSPKFLTKIVLYIPLLEILRIRKIYSFD